MNKPSVCAVVAVGKNRELGFDGKLLGRIPDDLKRFKQLMFDLRGRTFGNVVVSSFEEEIAKREEFDEISVGEF